MIFNLDDTTKGTEKFDYNGRRTGHNNSIEFQYLKILID